MGLGDLGVEGRKEERWESCVCRGSSIWEKSTLCVHRSSETVDRSRREHAVGVRGVVGTYYSPRSVGGGSPGRKR